MASLIAKGRAAGFNCSNAVTTSSSDPTRTIPVSQSTTRNIRNEFPVTGFLLTITIWARRSSIHPPAAQNTLPALRKKRWLAAGVNNKSTKSFRCRVAPPIETTTRLIPLRNSP